MQESRNFETHASQKTVTMEKWNSLDQGMSYQIVAKLLVAFASVLVQVIIRFQFQFEWA